MLKNNDLKIGSIKLESGGLKGMQVQYLKPVLKNGNTFMDKYDVTKHAPVSFELMDKFSRLGHYLLDICGYTTNELEREQLMSLLEVTKISAGSESFQISGKLKVLGSNLVVSLTTPMIKESLGYDDYDAVMKLVDSIYDDTREYVGGKMMSEQELALHFYKDKEGFNEEDFNKLPEAERIRMGTAVLEKLGCIVINEKEVDAVAEEGLTDDKPLLTAAVRNDLAEEVVDNDDLNFELEGD